MNYTAELKKFVTSQYIYSAVRITLAIVIPCLLLAHFGLLKEYFLFPLGTSFIGLTDQPGTFIRRRNALIFAILSFFFIALIASLLKGFPILVFFEIITFGMFFSLIGVYGQRLATLGSISLVVLAIFIDGHLLVENNIPKSLLIFSAGTVWFFIIFLIVSKIQPYKLAGQMIGENYLQLAEFLRIKANYYQKNPNFNELLGKVISKQVEIKNLQEDTREIVFKTRIIVNESTTTSRLLMLLFLNSIDLHEKLMTSESDYEKLHKRFGESDILQKIQDYLHLLSDEISNIGIGLQSSLKAKPIHDLSIEISKLHHDYYDLRKKELASENLEDFLILRNILLRVTEITQEIKEIYPVFSQDIALAKSLSTGLDYGKFISHQEQLNFKVLKNNFSLKSSIFRHSIRVTIALLIGYFISKLRILGIGHSYWILITIIAIIKPAYATTKHRNLLRLYGTIVGAVFAYAILYFIKNDSVLFTILLISMILCFSFLKARYMFAILFMTVYVFLTFNFLNPGNINILFKDRILDTIIAGIVVFLVTYYLLPVWEHTQNLDLMKKSSASNIHYFESVFLKFLNENFDTQDYKIKRKEAIIALANLSDNFQRMISDPKNQQQKLEIVHQFVATSHLITAYTASLSQYSNSNKKYPEIDAENWYRKINAELLRTNSILKGEKFDENIKKQSKIEPEDLVEELLSKRKIEIEENEFYDRRDQNRVSYLTEIKNIQEILELVFDVAKEQRKVAENVLNLSIHQQS